MSTSPVAGPPTTAVSYASTAHAHAEMVSQTRKVPVSAGARVYEISISGQAGNVLRAAFDDCTMTIEPGLTILRAQLPDQAALWSLIQRIAGLGLELLELRLVAPASQPGNSPRRPARPGRETG